MNYKIEVENKEQADEAQELFFELGLDKEICTGFDFPKLVITNGDYSSGAPLDYYLGSECESVSFDQLRALVSLHKNPINMDKVLSEVRSDALGLLNDQYAEIEQVRKEYKSNHTGSDLPDFLIEDTVNHPSHYASGEIECIDAMEAMLTPEQFIGYLRGNVAKYLWRYDKKNGKEDLSKAIWYLNKLNNMY